MTDIAGGAREFRDLARNLRLVGEEELLRELYSAIDEVARPLAGEVRSRLMDYMPDPYAEVLSADLRLSVSRRTGADPGVRITAASRGAMRRRLRRLEGGTLAHPLYGHRKHWYYQTSHVVAGFFSGPLEESAPRVRQAIGNAMARIAHMAAGRP